VPALVFGAASFLSAFLVFQIQPLIGKYVLPWYGGAAGVWTTCVLVFQTLLFAGYAYAHGLARLRVRTQVLVHVALLLAAAALPILPHESWKPAGDEDPLARIVRMLVVTVGVPYFALAANGPLLQAWHHRLAPERSPYALYALSNAGSLLALLSYPVLVEPNLAGPAQGSVWRAGFGLYVLLAAVLGLHLWRAGTRTETAERAADDAPPPLARRLAWIGWAACGVVLFMAITSELTLNVAAVPFLWVLPLAVYLLTFIVAFSGERAYPRRWMGVLMVLALVAVVGVLELELRQESQSTLRLPIPLEVGILVGALLVLCLVCHGELYRLRPAPSRLTSFYLSIAFGGALGGITVGVLAPRFFLLHQELALGLLMCCGLYVGLRLREPGSRLALARGRLAPAAAGLGVLVLLGLSVRQAARMLAGSVRTERSFFGLLRVKEFAPGDERSRAFQLYDGAIVHGYQLALPELRSLPTTYYATTTGVGRALRLRQLQGPVRAGVVGLGVGTLAAHGRAGDSFRFYEINPDVLSVAREDFHFLGDTPAAVEVVLGDARLQLEREPPQGFDFLVLDAFSSDAIPVHLLTREAMAVYERHLAPGGILAFNVSNLHLELATVVYRLAEAGQFHALEVRSSLDPASFALPADWLILSRDTRYMNRLLLELEPERASGALHLQNQARATHAGVVAWTDEKSSLFRILR
jgi:hypothetical protein